MAYCSSSDLLAEFGEAELVEATDKTGIGLLDEATVAAAIARADRIINRHLAGRTALPLEADTVVDLACDIARFYCYTARPAPSDVRIRFEDAMAQLVALGKRALAPADSAGTTAPATAGGAEVRSGGHVFGRDDDSFI